jgi:hypothetical protein
LRLRCIQTSQGAELPSTWSIDQVYAPLIS